VNIAEYLDKLVEATEALEQIHHGIECDCQRCEAAWAEFKKLQDNEPEELKALLGGEN
jgi:DNA phosphorothioation-dependent restriction protein DptG